MAERCYGEIGLTGISVVPGAPPWTPNDITGIVEYWDFSDTSKMTQAGGVTQQVIGQKGIYTLTQATAGARPITGTRTINSVNVLDFDGSNDGMSCSVVALTQPCTYLAVYQNDVASGDQRVFDTQNRQLYDAAITGTNLRTIYAGSFAIAGSAGTTNAEQAVIVFNGASSQVWINGVSDITGNPGTQSSGGFLFVGFDSSSGPTALFDGRLAFLGLVAGAISSGNRTSWNTYCARWGL